MSCHDEVERLGEWQLAGLKLVGLDLGRGGGLWREWIIGRYQLHGYSAMNLETKRARVESEVTK